MISKELSIETMLLVEMIRSVPHGETITFGRMSDEIGRDISKCRHLIQSAFRVLEREDGAAFMSIRGKGYKRLPADQIVTIGQTARARIRSAARRGIKTIAAASAKTNDLTPDQHRRLLSEQSTLGMVEFMSREKFLSEVAEGDNKPMPVAVTAQAFLRKIGAVKE